MQKQRLGTNLDDPALERALVPKRVVLLSDLSLAQIELLHESLSIPHGLLRLEDGVCCEGDTNGTLLAIGDLSLQMSWVLNLPQPP